ncbi:MAG: PASTA domain-containing protein [Oscillospiraceae bacterium]|nr:PASTA domain-containing protein [Oscillospiraceae bacterium]MBQ3224195.1 PASTA domain-containing protein [Oscillospiraceae bacterium]MBQ6698424.1 PASTA domain-containing protein [Oscillospiraceae bacterium]
MARKGPSNKILGRIIFCMFFCLTVGFLPLVGALVKIQLIDYKKYQSMAIEQQTRDTVITPKRGVIYDRNMKEIAVSATAETVFISPAEMETEEDARTVAKILSETLELEYDDVLKKTENKKSYYQVIKKKIDIEAATKLREQIKEHGVKGIHLAEDTKRYYPYGSFASQVIGFCGDDNTGLFGIEMKYENVLKGMPGRVIAAKNARGTDMSFQYEEYHDAQNGQNLVLTIDETIQQVLENHLRTAVIDGKIENRGAGIVYNIKTGEILAMATYGDFDLNAPFEITDPEALKRIEEASEDERKTVRSNELQASWRNKFISDAYEPGSVFKILTVAMGYEEGVVNENSSFNCPGGLRVADRTIHCWKREGHGNVSLSQALEKSCNCALMNIAARIGNEKFYNYCEGFGLLDKTGVDLIGEAGGYFFNEKDFKNPKNKVSLAVASFGQTFKVTPMQIVCAVGAVVNDGKLMKPHLVKEIVDDNGIVIKKNEAEIVRQIISEKTSDFINASIEETVATGTGKNARVSGYRIGGKTGTSEKVDEYTAEEGKKYIASFFGVAPMEDPEIAILVMLDTPRGIYLEGSQLAAPVAGKVFGEILPYLGFEPTYTADELVGAEVTMPNLIGGTGEGVNKLLSTNRNYSSFTIKTVGDGKVCTDQLPAEGSKIPKNSTIVVYMGGKAEGEQVEMPNVIGMTPESANKVLTNAGLYMKANGAVSERSSAVGATKQQYPEGTKLNKGTVVSVEFYDIAGVSEGISR